jgi:hypothetical protein
MDWYAHDGKVLQRLTGNPDGTSAAVDIAIVDKAVVGSDLGKREVISYNDLSDYQKKTVNELREEMGLRRYDAIYEEEYVSSWTNGENSLIPT